MEVRPVPLAAGVPFAIRSHILMANNSRGIYSRISLYQHTAQPGCLTVLCHRKRLLLIPNHLDANGIIIAVRTALPCRLSRMPGASLARHELRDVSSPIDNKVGGYTHSFKAGKARMRTRIKCAEKEVFDGLLIKLSRRQADGMQHDQVNVRTVWARIAMWRW